MVLVINLVFEGTNVSIQRGGQREQIGDLVLVAVSVDWALWFSIEGKLARAKQLFAISVQHADDL